MDRPGTPDGSDGSAWPPAATWLRRAARAASVTSRGITLPRSASASSDSSPVAPSSDRRDDRVVDRGAARPQLRRVAGGQVRHLLVEARQVERTAGVGCGAGHGQLQPVREDGGQRELGSRPPQVIDELLTDARPPRPPGAEQQRHDRDQAGCPAPGPPPPCQSQHGCLRLRESAQRASGLKGVKTETAPKTVSGARSARSARRPCRRRTARRPRTWTGMCAADCGSPATYPARWRAGR